MGQENAELRGQVSVLSQQVAGGNPLPSEPASPEPPSPETVGRPARHAFGDEEAYFAALAEWTADRKIAAALEAQQRQADEQARREEQTQVQEAFHARLHDAKQRIDDYDDVVDNSDIQVSDAVSMAIYESPAGPEIMHYLAQNPAEAERLNRLGDRNPIALGRAFAQMEAELVSASPPSSSDTQSPPPADAPARPPPAPIQPVAGGGPPPTPDDPGTMSFRDYAAARRKGTIR
jgi:hypothetical protein